VVNVMSNFFAGLDLGQAADSSALVIVEQIEHLPYDPALVRTVTEWVDGPMWNNFGRPESSSREQVTRQVLLQPDGSYGPIPSPDEPAYDVRHVQRWKLGTSYPTIVDDVVTMLLRAPLAKECPLIVDATGVGRPVVDMFYAHKRWDFPMTPVTITGGVTVTHDGGYMHVPKRDLVGVVQVLLQSRRLRFPEASKVPEVATLVSELGTFQTKISLATAHDSYGAWREGTHDDLVLSLALALWYAERCQYRVH